MYGSCPGWNRPSPRRHVAGQSGRIGRGLGELLGAPLQLRAVVLEKGDASHEKGVHREKTWDSPGKLENNMNFTGKTGEKRGISPGILEKNMGFHLENRRKTWIHMGFQLENWGSHIFWRQSNGISAGRIETTHGRVIHTEKLTNEMDSVYPPVISDRKMAIFQFAMFLYQRGISKIRVIQPWRSWKGGEAVRSLKKVAHMSRHRHWIIYG